MCEIKKQTGQSHLQILHLLDNPDRHVSYVIKKGTSAGYYLCIACQVLWTSRQEYAVDHEKRVVKYQYNDMWYTRAFKEDQPYYQVSRPTNYQGVTIVYDHAVLEADKNPNYRP